MDEEDEKRPLRTGTRLGSEFSYGPAGGLEED